MSAQVIKSPLDEKEYSLFFLPNLTPGMSVEVTKSPLDEKEYRCVTLDNGLKVLLISEYNLAHQSDDESGCESGSGESESSENENRTSSTREGFNNCSRKRRRTDTNSTDEEARKNRKKQLFNAACGLCVRVGSFHDPPELPGLAHLLEHMLFMGSEKYPGENEFDSFVSSHGGSTNAFTGYEMTSYCFEINKKHFQEALDKFAHFFISPLIMESSLEREIEAVDSEFKDSLQSDSNRRQQFFCSLALPNHPLRNFPWGNKETLKVVPSEKGVNVVENLRKFYELYYSASYMTLTVISEDSLNTLECWVRNSFSGIPTNNKPFPSITHCQPVFDDQVFHRLYKIVPVKSSHKLSLSWLLPPTLSHYKEKPVEYLSMLVGHEGFGSILSQLKKRNLATSLEAGTGSEDSETNSCFSLFICTVTLSEFGVRNIFEVLTIIFQYLKLLQKEGPQKRLFDEFRLIEENNFKFEEEEDNYDLVERLCESMQLYAPEDYLTGEYLYFNYKPDLISSFLELLTPQNCFICLISKMFKDDCHKTAPWFNTLYNDEVISLEWEASWKDLQLHPDLFLPHPNKFIASEFSLLPGDVSQTKYPVVVKETKHYKIWYKKDDIFNLPKASISLSFVTPPEFQLVAENVVLLELFHKLFNISIMEEGYEAIAAGLEYSLTITDTGLSLCMYGYNHKLPDLFKMLVKFLSSFEVTEETFNIAMEQLKIEYYNILLKSKNHSFFLRLQILKDVHIPISERDVTLTKLTFENYNVFAQRLRKELFIDALFQGNVTASESVKLMEFLCSCWNFTPLTSERKMPKCLRLPGNTALTLYSVNKDKDSLSTAITDYYQLSVAEPREEVMAELIADCMSEPCFDELRTKKQLGYTVLVSDHNTHRVSGLSIAVMTQATKSFSEDYVSQCMNDFMTGFASRLDSWSEEEFQSHVDSLIDIKEEDDDCLDDEVDRNWSEILTQSYQFDKLEKHVKALEKITKTKASRWLRRYTQPGGEDYRKISIKVLSQQGYIDPSRIITLTSDSLPKSITTGTTSAATGANEAQSSLNLENVSSTQSTTQVCSSVPSVTGAAQALGSLENLQGSSGSGSPCMKEEGRRECRQVRISEGDIEEFKSRLRAYPRGTASSTSVATHFSPPSLSVSKDSSFPAMMSYSSQPESPSLPQKVGDASKLAAGSSAAATMKEPLSPTPVKLYKLDDFKDLTYQEMTSKSQPMMEAIHSNVQLHSSLESLLMNSASANEDLRSILHYCNKGGLLSNGSSARYVSTEVDEVFDSLNKNSMEERRKEVQGLLLISEAILGFNFDLTKTLGLTFRQRQKLLRQFHSTPVGSCLHSFCDKGAWSDPDLRPLLEHCGYKLANGHIQLYRGIHWSPKTSKRDVIRSATMGLLGIQVVLHKDTEGTIL